MALSSEELRGVLVRLEAPEQRPARGVPAHGDAVLEHVRCSADDMPVDVPRLDVEGRHPHRLVAEVYRPLQRVPSPVTLEPFCIEGGKSMQTVPYTLAFRVF